MRNEKEITAALLGQLRDTYVCFNSPLMSSTVQNASTMRYYVIK